ncbi:Eisosome component PIL1-domain-containing protein [Gamsiella multidivaricata]|uniref:Eisosome component PIL1-domain-containing protein n=1 Tax=Gamsiella multidivaricata TaxID=101098 RepID=UPI0022206B7D|nr:Eisosome component PIL1-domain-containing protein [Gamsiella multidivaricata]KAI7825333.1 Eisosome component PIL1-domain-containing protein [Gamsiella multidivaricata]
MDLLSIRSHFSESARQAAGTFLTPLTNAIGEQRRLVESLAVVSKVRVEECKHMMTWSKYQTEDLGDVLLKLNLLIRKISDYEIRFGTQYEGFREKIKYLRTKDDTLCEMGRRQTDLQTKIVEASKSRLRSAKAMLLQKELEDIQKENEPQETQLQHLKRKLIKDAYTEQLNAIVELGKKMQIIGQHGLKLLDHIDLTCSTDSYDDGRKTEYILREARIALENWDQLIIADSKLGPVHPPPPAVVLSEAFSDPIATSSSKNSSSAASLKGSASVAVTKNAPPLPPRSPDITPVPGTPKPERDTTKEGVLEQERLRRLEELEIKQAMELSLAERPVKGKDIDDLNLSAEELSFVMGELEEERLKKTNKSMKDSGAVKGGKNADHGHDLVAAKAATAPKIIRSPQVAETTDHLQSHQAPRPWVSVKKPKRPEDETSTPVAEELEGSSTSVAEELGGTSTSVVEELGGSSAPAETMGEDAHKPIVRRNTAASYYKALKSMNEPPPPLESMGSESEVAPESMGHDDGAPYMVMPQVPALDEIRREKIQTNQLAQQQQQQDQQLSSPFPLSPELQYLQVRDSPQLPHQTTPPGSFRAGNSLSLPTAPTGTLNAAPMGSYQTPIPYRPTTTYVPHGPKARNRLSGGPITPPPSGGDSALQSQLAHQKAYQLAHQKSYQQSYQETYQHSRQQDNDSRHSQPHPQPGYSSQYQQHQQHQNMQHQQKQLQDFYYTPREQAYQQYQQQNPATNTSQPTAWNWSYPVFNSDYQYKEEHYGDSEGPSPAPSHISLIPDTSASSPVGTPTTSHAYKMEL